jgi:hypothetical protein
MLEAWQTPHGARPNREGIPDSNIQNTSRLEGVKLSGRSLEPISNDRPRGMTVSGSNAVQNSAYRSDIACGPQVVKAIWGLSIGMRSLVLRLRSGFRQRAQTSTFKSRWQPLRINANYFDQSSHFRRLPPGELRIRKDFEGLQPFGVTCLLLERKQDCVLSCFLLSSF